jgi:hypothetical protein
MMDFSIGDSSSGVGGGSSTESGMIGFSVVDSSNTSGICIFGINNLRGFLCSLPTCSGSL